MAKKKWTKQAAEGDKAKAGKSAYSPEREGDSGKAGKDLATMTSAHKKSSASNKTMRKSMYGEKD